MRTRAEGGCPPRAVSMPYVRVKLVDERAPVSSRRLLISGPRLSCSPCGSMNRIRANDRNSDKQRESIRSYAGGGGSIGVAEGRVGGSDETLAVGVHRSQR